MKDTIILTEEQLKALQAGLSITIKPPKQFTKWEPDGGDYLISNSFGTAFYDGRHKATEIESGRRFKTKKEAKKSAKALRSYARQLKWLLENDDGWEADWSNNKQKKYFVYYNTISKLHTTAGASSLKHLHQVHMSEANADKLCQLLNDGIVEF